MDASPTSDAPLVLFVCVHNAGRSQMAAALLNRHGGGRVRVRSAGSAPASEVNAVVVQAMAELGIDISRELPTRLADEDARAADVVVTMGCGDACPVYPGKRYLDWELPDPAGQGVEAVRHIRDEIERRSGRLSRSWRPRARSLGPANLVHAAGRRSARRRLKSSSQPPQLLDVVRGEVQRLTSDCSRRDDCITATLAARRLGRTLHTVCAMVRRGDLPAEVLVPDARGDRSACATPCPR
jgi:arsenate reductase